jgi:predicted secreted protein
MGLVNGIVLFIVLWWVVFFMALPFGVQSDDEAGEDTVAGTVSSAPVKPKLGLKVLITTVVAAAAWGAIWWSLDTGLISIY